MDDPDTGCFCASSNNSCGVMPVTAALQLGRVLLMQGGYLPVANSNTNATRITRYNLLPRQLLAYVGNLTTGYNVFAIGELFDELPAGFGCPDWPLPQASLNNTGQQQSLREQLWSMYYGSPPEETLMPNVSCWVDARVAANLLTGAILQGHMPCHDTAPTEVCRNITIFWQPPNSPCTETDADARAAQCANITYRFQAPVTIPCDEGSMQLHNTTGQAAAVTDQDNSTSCYTSNPWA